MRRILLVALTACSFDHGHAPSDAPAADAIDAPPDAPGCRAAAIAAHGAHTCIARNDGAVRCWGKNGQGEIARPPAASETCIVQSNPYACFKSPVDTMVPVAVTALGAGDQHACAIGAGKVYCWGANDSGQFGGGSGDKYVPFEVTARAGATAIAGGSTHTCSLEDGTLSCSGGNGNGEVGDGSTSNAFTPFAAKTGVTGFGTGFINTYALVGTEVWGWGDNQFRQIDNSGMDPRASPVAIGGVTNARAIAGGSHHVCAVLANQTAACWGRNDQAQLGRTFASSDEGPGVVAVTTGVSELTAGTNHTCIKRVDKTVVCFGEGYLPSGTEIALAGPAATIASGSYHDCAILENGTVWCWGWNAYGQLGNGTTNESIDNTPRQAVVCP